MVAPGRDEVATFSGVAEMASESETEVVCPLVSLTEAVKGKAPVTDVVPETTPVADSEMPEGSEPEVKLQLYGALPPVAVKFVE